MKYCCALDSGRYQLSDPLQNAQFFRHLQRFRESARTSMVQPYMHNIDHEGETALIYMGGRFSHAVRKPPILHGPDERKDRRFEPNGGIRIANARPTASQLVIADQVLSIVQEQSSALLYARVDLIPGYDGNPVVLEVELIEPSLFLTHADKALERFASTIREFCMSRDGKHKYASTQRMLARDLYQVRKQPKWKSQFK